MPELVGLDNLVWFADAGGNDGYGIFKSNPFNRGIE